MKYSIFCQSRAHNSGHTGMIQPIIELDRDLVAIYIMSKFENDCFRNVDARVVTNQLWTTDGRRTDDGRQTSNDPKSSP